MLSTHCQVLSSLDACTSLPPVVYGSNLDLDVKQHFFYFYFLQEVAKRVTTYKTTVEQVEEDEVEVVEEELFQQQVSFCLGSGF